MCTSMETPSLIIEPHPEGYTGLPFITLIQYRKEPILVIVDNVWDGAVQAYVLDLCGPEQVNETLLLEAAVDWYGSGGPRPVVPFSIALSRDGVSTLASKVYRSLRLDFITRVIGPLPTYDMSEATSIKRRKRRLMNQDSSKDRSVDIGS